MKKITAEGNRRLVHDFLLRLPEALFALFATGQNISKHMSKCLFLQSKVLPSKMQITSPLQSVTGVISPPSRPSEKALNQ